MMNMEDSIYVAGSTGLVGSAIVRRLKDSGYRNVIGYSSHDFDLTDEQNVNTIFRIHKPKFVFNAAAVVGGILANERDRIRFLQENLAIQRNLITAASDYRVDRYMFLGSTCIYPRDAPVPTMETALLTGPLEKTNEAYALAKIAGVKEAQYFWEDTGLKTICLMPTNLYGPNDNFNQLSGHVVPSLINKFCTDRDVVRCLGTGSPQREFMHVDDLADAAVFMMNNQFVQFGTLYNVGTSVTHSISEIVSMIKEYSGSKAEVQWNTDAPNGAYRRLLDSSRISALGWKSKIRLEDGLKDTILWYRSNYPNVKK